jgi:hypothetical protein
MTPRAHGSTNGCTITALSRISSGPTSCCRAFVPLTMGNSLVIELAITHDLLTYTALAPNRFKDF